LYLSIFLKIKKNKNQNLIIAKDNIF